MKKYLLCFLTLSVSLIITGCASSGAIPVGQDAYLLNKRGFGGIFTTGVAVKIEVIQEGQQYCASTGKKFKLLNAKSQDAVPAQSLPWAEIEFLCVDSNDPRLKDVTQGKNPSNSVRMAD
jgi:hypothetical protein